MLAAIDTLQISKDLQAAGIEARQAEAITVAVEQARLQGMEELVTREYLHTELAGIRTEMATEFANVRMVIADVRTDVANLRTEVFTEIANLRTELAESISKQTNKLVFWMLVVAGLVIAVMKLIP